MKFTLCPPTIYNYNISLILAFASILAGIILAKIKFIAIMTKRHTISNASILITVSENNPTSDRYLPTIIAIDNALPITYKKLSA